MRERFDVTATWVTPAGLLPDGIHATAVGQRDFVDAVLADIVACAA